ncbi:MAG TPA: MerR family transcriptional regulator [Candidatus Cryosericum sp.]|nr:MerR family transcriptional regulator [Candidatus Cryosericum sp.]
MPDEIPRKLFYRLNEVCQITDTQPYVLRFWESEFSQLAAQRSRTGQRLYRRKDIDLVLAIKRLLHEEGCSIASAREQLGMPDQPGTMESLFEPPRSASPPPDRAARTVVRELEEILRLMESTDRRLGGRRDGHH